MRTITLNIIHGYSNAVLKVSQYDKGYEVAATIRKGVEDYTIPTGYTVTVEGRKPDGTGYQYPATYDGSIVTFSIMEQMTVLSGRSVAEAVFYDAESVRVGTANFAILVEPAPLNGDVPISETDLPLIQTAVQAAAEAQASASSASASANTATQAASSAGASAESAETSAESAEGSAEDSEAWAVGQRGGVDVDETDPTYHNNAKYYAEQGGGSSGAVQSVNGKTGDVVLDASDVGALPDDTVIPTKTSDLTNDSGYLTEIPSQYVTDSEMQTALAEKADTDDIPTKTSELTNDSGFLTAIPSEYVTDSELQAAIDGTLTVSGAAADAKVTGDRIRAIETAFDSKAPVIINSASGDPATISDGADNLPFKSVAVNIAPLQSGSGDPSPDNVRPISGWTAVNVTRTGKNLLNQADVTLPSENAWASRAPFPSAIPPGNYVFSVTASVTGGMTFNIWNSDGTNIASKSFAVTAGARTQVAFSISEYGVSYGGYYNKGGTLSDFMLEVGSTSTAYEPYTAQTYSITFPSSAGTVYGGTLDVTTGKLVVDRKIARFGDVNWIYTANRFYCEFPDGVLPSLNTIQDFACSAYKNANVLQYANMADGTALYAPNSFSSTRKLFVVRDDRYTDANSFKTAMTDQTVIYPLATPIEYTLTPTEIRTLLGDNVVYADAGSVDVQYPADTKLYIDGKIAELQALVLENA